MQGISAESTHASQALVLVESLQRRFVRALEAWGGEAFVSTDWLRDAGRHGGGVRYGIGDSERLDRASVNVSQVHYDDEPTRRLASASAISAIVHPAHPNAPSAHIHISWTEQKSGSGYWRIMADLNPSIPNKADTQRFSDTLKLAAPEQFEDAIRQGDRYFFIPVLGRHRGTAHFYLEDYSSGDFEADLVLAKRVGEAAIDIYARILEDSVRGVSHPSEDQVAAQLAYHTLYFFQVLTLDRGTTTGLLVHDQNDIGILGSLPSRIDRTLLSSWISRMEPPQDLLLEKLLAALPQVGVCSVDDEVKQKLADAVRAHYRKYPEALDLQASGNSMPPTINNHK